MMRSFSSVVFALALVACASSDDRTQLQFSPAAPPAGFADALRIAPPAVVPKLTKRVSPRTPNELFGVSTEVKVDVYVAENGQVAGVVYTEGDLRFFPAVSEAASRWRFEPLVAEGSPQRFIFPLTTTLTWRTNPRMARVVLDYRASDSSPVPPK
jgi:hypothetical protein